ncbi:MAG: RNA 2',3'-cyclic phosphodiesterase [Oscillospiraceae bacterium]|nr:RNA 2',3'-cyclic phosphodiesterase [Oscillospiraceae bacterium]
MRLFLAIPLSGEIKDALLDAQDALYARGVRGNYTSEENMHLTLAFIGEYPSAQPVLDALAGLSFAPFPLTLEGMGCFGELWWSGIKDSAPLVSLARRIRRALAERQIPFDNKRFSPHITLIRRASGRPPCLAIRPESMRVDRVSLMRSERGKNGMIYTELGAIEALEEAKGARL